MIAIIASQEEEIKLLVELLRNKIELKRGPISLYKGVLEGKNVLLVLSGNGKVNAAAVAQLVILEGVSSIIFTGVAGGLLKEQKIGDIVIASDSVQHDMDVTALGYRLGEVPDDGFSFESDPRLVELAFSAAMSLEGIEVKKGRVLTGDQFINSSEKIAFLQNEFAAACVEMEGAAIAQIAKKWHCPFVIIRSLSDTADENSHMDFKEFIDLAAKNAKLVVLNILQQL
ncbi:MAG TPA: 5'-methylthioadenosine/adenosylhomocysteine nucleosidase [Trueperaceae bacterium]|nr:5'-methylthioadenosine/adenosylhomocysteine nucleosidase [Trueperaceae bacterium]